MGARNGGWSQMTQAPQALSYVGHIKWATTDCLCGFSMPSWLWGGATVPGRMGGSPDE